MEVVIEISAIVAKVRTKNTSLKFEVMEMLENVKMFLSTIYLLHLKLL